MSNVSRKIDEQDRAKINAAIAAAEAQTAAEIVPVIARESGRYDRAEDIAGLCLAILALVVAWLIFQRVDADPERWLGAHLALDLVDIVLILIGGFIVGSLLASHIGWLRRLFTTRAEMTAEVNENARHIFFDQRVHHARSGSGVLVYVSLFERTAAVIADDAVIEKLGMPAIESLCDELIAKLRGGDVVDALTHTIALAGEKLSHALPRQRDDVNELLDALVMID